MTILDEGKQIRSEIAKLRPDNRRRYSKDLRRRILDWISRCGAAGMSEADCSTMIGVRTNRFFLWRQYEQRKEDEERKEREPLALVPVESPMMTDAPITLVTPGGYQVVGLAIGQLVTLLRELA